MMQLRNLFITLIMLAGIRFSAENNEYMEVWKPEQDALKFPDYNVLQDPAESTQNHALPTCLLCVCLSGSVYCEDITPEIKNVPTLPKETGYLYARFNSIKKIRNGDFADMETLRRIDLTGNLISEIDDGAFSRLHNLEELILAQNRLTKLPMLPNNLAMLNVNFNKLRTQGVKATAFRKLTRLAYLYLGNNELTAVPHLPESLYVVHLHNNRISSITDETFCRGNTSYYIRTNMDQVRLDGNPINLADYPNSFVCLRSLPVGWYN